MRLFEKVPPFLRFEMELFFSKRQIEEVYGLLLQYRKNERELQDVERKLKKQEWLGSFLDEAKQLQGELLLQTLQQIVNGAADPAVRKSVEERISSVQKKAKEGEGSADKSAQQ